MASRNEINAKIDELRDLLVESGQMDEATAEASLFAVRPGDGGTIVGNLADLQRMGAIAVTGEIPAMAMPEGDQGTIETTNIQDAFAEPPSVDGEIDPNTGQPRVENRGEVLEPTDQARPDTQPVSESMTKQELLDEASRRGVTADDSMTKADIISAINAA